MSRIKFAKSQSQFFRGIHRGRDIEFPEDENPPNIDPHRTDDPDCAPVRCPTPLSLLFPGCSGSRFPAVVDASLSVLGRSSDSKLTAAVDRGRIHDENRQAGNRPTRA
jgi:hypothetical protein